MEIIGISKDVDLNTPLSYNQFLNVVMHQYRMASGLRSMEKFNFKRCKVMKNYAGSMVLFRKQSICFARLT
jgi:hypothetical protein